MIRCLSIIIVTIIAVTLTSAERVEYGAASPYLIFPTLILCLWSLLECSHTYVARK